MFPDVAQSLPGAKLHGAESHWLKPNHFLQSGNKGGMCWEEAQASSGPRGDSRCRSGRASVSTAPALSGQRPGRRGRSGPSPRAWTRVPGASCTSSPAAGCNQQRRSAEQALNSRTVSKTRKIGRTHEKQLGISNWGFLKLWLQSSPKFSGPPFLPGLGEGTAEKRSLSLSVKPIPFCL